MADWRSNKVAFCQGCDQTRWTYYTDTVSGRTVKRAECCVVCQRVLEVEELDDDAGTESHSD